MKQTLLSMFLLLTAVTRSVGQDSPVQTASSWQVETQANFYVFRDDFFVLPIVKADKNKLHLEARYNYEDRQTFSAWAGYNLMGGNKLEYTITPMIGGVVGLSNGFATGLEMTFNLNRFELYTESEGFIDGSATENNFFYNWTDLTYSPKDWLWVGISGQRTRLYKTNLDIQRGVLIGGGKNNWELNAYLYNVGFDEAFGLMSFSMRF
jgi:hypothetical protein